MKCKCDNCINPDCKCLGSGCTDKQCSCNCHTNKAEANE